VFQFRISEKNVWFTRAHLDKDLKFEQREVSYGTFVGVSKRFHGYGGAAEFCIGIDDFP
jgi:hypothetical protein